jgi:hypothetical protein
MPLPGFLPNRRKEIGLTRAVGPFFLRHSPITAPGARLSAKIGLQHLSRAGAFAPVWRKTTAEAIILKDG